MGVVHLGPCPSAFRAEAGGFDAVLQAALEDARALAGGGADAILVENFGDAPFHKGTRDDPVPPDVPAALAVTARAVREATGLPVAVNCLRNDGVAGLGAAVVAGATWIRVNVLAGAMVTDQGVIDGEAARLFAYARQMHTNVRVLADLCVKHAVPLAPVDPPAAARDLIERSGAHGLVLTGSRTGEPPTAEMVDSVRAAVGSFPLWLGSGLNPDNAAMLWPRCDGAIVGTAVKREGQVIGPVDESRVAALRAAIDRAC
jgi:membrane complex biogenesis BtpA family protein